MGMKCIKCGTHNILSDRIANEGRCKNCHHQFVFEPSSEMDVTLKFTDQFFAKVITEISTNDTCFFTPKQFLYLLNRRLKQQTFGPRFAWIRHYLVLSIFGCGCIGAFLTNAIGNPSLSFISLWLLLNLCFVIKFFYDTNSKNLAYQCRNNRAEDLQSLGIFILALSSIVIIIIVGIDIGISNVTSVIHSFIIFLIAVFLGALSFYLGTIQRRRQNLIPDTFLVEQHQVQEWINRWQLINEPINKILPSPREEIVSSAVSPDISAYSFDRAVICDSAAIAQMLIANNFHFENNCAVLSITGYPQNIFQTVMEMLRRNPNLKVYALHDATPLGVGLVNYLRTSPNWFANSNVMIYDLGLLPRQIFYSRNVFIRNSPESAQEAKEMPPTVQLSVSHSELVWLEAGNFVELESFSPQRIIQVLNRGIAQSQNASASDTLVLIDEGGGGFIYVNESFG